MVDLMQYEPDAEILPYELRKFGFEMADLPTEADANEAKNLLESLSILADKWEEEGNLNDYIYSALLLARTCNRRSFGVAASLVTLARREMGLAVDADPLTARMTEALKTSKHIHAEGKRFADQKVTFVKFTMTGQGYSILTFLTPENNIVKWFSNPAGLTPGQDYVMKATVRRHSTYNDVKETVVNRAVFS
jgi:hypothetical protein